MERPQRPELEVVEAARGGSTEAFTELVRLHHAAVRGYVARYLSGRDVVDDLAQEVFLAAHRGLANYRAEAPLRQWLLGIARRHVALLLREEMRRRAREAGSALEEALFRWQLDEVDGLPARPEARELQLDREREALAECLRALPPDSAELVDAFYFRAESSAAIAQRLGKKESAVRMALLRIRAALRTCLERSAEDAHEGLARIPTASEA
jgi:RNA polymerase sigma-70 factor (ECF subfamily)